MILTIPDVDTAATNHDAVGPRHLASERIAIRSVTALAVARDCRDDPRTQIDRAYRVVLGIDDVQNVIRERDAFGSVEGGAGSTELRI